MPADPPADHGNAARRFAIFEETLVERGINGVKPVECEEGLGLCTARPFDVGEVILDCAPERTGTLSGGYGDVERLCDELPFNPFLHAVYYWAALCSLTRAQASPEVVRLQEEDSGSAEGISEECQRRLLALHAPEALSWRASGIRTCLEVGVESQPAFVDLAAAAVAERWGLAPNLAPLLQQLALVWKYNSFETGGGRPGIYFAAALCNHSCDPAAYYEVEASGESAGPRLVMRALRPLVAGETVTISYISGTPTEPDAAAVAPDECRKDAARRRREIAGGWLFYCRCPQCSPPGSAAEACLACSGALSVWISERDSGPYGPTEGPVCDGCCEEDLVVAAPYFLHCPACEMDWCPDCAASLPAVGAPPAPAAP